MYTNKPVVDKIFDDLDEYRDFCRYEGKYYDEAALYNRSDRNWRAYEKYLEWKRRSGQNIRRPVRPRRQRR